MPRFNGTLVETPRGERFGGVLVDNSRGRRFGGVLVNDFDSEPTNEPYPSIHKLEPWEPGIFDWFNSLGDTDSNRARGMNELNARRIAKEQNIPVQDVYTKAGFLRPVLNTEGRPTAKALKEGLSIIWSQKDDVGPGVINAVLRTIRGKDETAEETFMDELIKGTEKETPNQADPNYDSLYGLGKSLGVSLTSMSAGAVAGALASETVVGAPIAAGAASGAVAYRIDVSTIVDQIKEVVDKKSMEINGRPLNQEEWDRVLEQTDTAVAKHGLWEAGPEAIGNLVFLRAITMPMKGLKTAVKAAEISKKAAESIITEQLTETATGFGQSAAEEELGLGKAKTIGEAFRDQTVQTGLISGLMLGGGNAARGIYEKGLQKFSPGSILGKEMQRMVDATEFTGTDDFARSTLDPSAAQMEAIPKEFQDAPRRPVADTVSFNDDVKAVSQQIGGAQSVDEAIATASNIIDEEINISDIDRQLKEEFAKIPKAAPAVEPSVEPATPKVAPQEIPVRDMDQSRFQKPDKEEHKVKGLDIVETPIAELAISEDVPQFKDGANAKGVVEPLGGTFDRTGVAPIQVWVRSDGRKEIISGRHRADLAERSGEQTIPAQYHYESKGFDAAQAASLDALLNIREGQGQVKDYVEFIRGTEINEKEADAQGILARSTGKKAFTIASKGGDALITAHRGDQITDEGAARIAAAAPNSEKFQAVGLKALQDGQTITTAENMVKATKYMSEDAIKSGGDLFAFDDSAIKEAETLAKKANKKQIEIQRSLSAVQGAAKRPDLAKKEGVDVKDPTALKSRINELKKQKQEWSNWHQDPAKVAELKVEDFKLGQETETQRLQREKDEAAATAAKVEQEIKAEQKAQADKETDSFSLTGSNAPADIAMAGGQESLFGAKTKPKTVKPAKESSKPSSRLSDTSEKGSTQTTDEPSADYSPETETTEWKAALKKFGPKGMTKKARHKRAEDAGFNTNTVFQHDPSYMAGTTKKESIKRIKTGEHETMFDGLFSISAEYYEDIDLDEKENSFFVKKHLDHKGFNDLFYGDLKKTRDNLANEIPGYGQLTENQKEIIDELVTEEQDNLHDLANEYAEAPEWITELFGEKDIGLIEWNIQKIRGHLAKDFGYDAVDMSDENGTSTLLLPGNGVRNINAAFDPDFKDSADLLKEPAQSYSPLSSITLSRKVTGKNGTIQTAYVKADVVLRRTRKKRDLLLKLLGCVNG